MRIRFYKNPEQTQWLGWFENCKGEVMGFICLDGTITWEW